MFWICIHCAREGRGSPTLWSTYYEIKAVLEAPVIEKRKVQTIYDDSRRIVDMTEIKPNLYIGDELITFHTNLINIAFAVIIAFRALVRGMHQ